MISIYFSLTSDEFVFKGIEYCSNGSLQKYVYNTKENNEEKMKSFSKQIMLAMYRLKEKRIVHGDLKPENILIDELGRLKLVYFDLDRMTNSQCKLTSGIDLSVRKMYLSPELENSEPKSEKSDVWSIGVVLLELAFGRDAYSDSEISSMNSIKIRG